MKKWIMFCVVIMFLCSGFSFSQDCGKCPAKSSCKAAKLKTTAAQEKDPVVFISPIEKKFHKKDCKLVKEKIELKLSQAKEKGFEPCPECFPPEKKEVEKTEPKK